MRAAWRELALSSIAITKRFSPCPQRPHCSIRGAYWQGAWREPPSVVNQIYQPKTDSGVPRLPCIARASVKSAVRTHQSRSCPHNPRLVHPWWPGTPGPSPRPWVSAWRQFYFVSRSAAGLTACTRLSGVPVGCSRRVIGAARAVRRCPSRPRESVADGCLVCGR